MKVKQAKAKLFEDFQAACEREPNKARQEEFFQEYQL